MKPSDVRSASGLTYRVLFAALLAVPTVPAQADDLGQDDPFRFSIGGMDHQGDGYISSNRDDLPLDRLTFADLGIGDDTGIGWARFAWQFADAWQFSLTYSGFDASGFNMAIDPGNFDDTNWQIGAALTSNLDLELFIVDLSWHFLTTDEGHIGMGAGLHAADFDFDLLVEATGLGGGVGGDDLVVVGREEASVLAPLPNLSLGGGYRLAENVYFDASLGWLSLSYDRYDGRLFSARSAIEWRPRNHAGFGIAYQHVDIDVEVEGSRSVERYDLDFYGPILFVSVGF